MPHTIYTLGHSTHSIDTVVTMLRNNNVTALIDVRSYPASRRNPQWNHDTLPTQLPTDITYTWIKNLGGRRYTPKDTPTPNTAWRVASFNHYADHMATPDFHNGLTQLLTIATTNTPAIMCSEALPWRCHRRLITDALLIRGHTVRHIMNPTTTRNATLTDFAHTNGTTLTYPATQ